MRRERHITSDETVGEQSRHFCLAKIHRAIYNRGVTGKSDTPLFSNEISRYYVLPRTTVEMREMSVHRIYQRVLTPSDISSLHPHLFP